METALLIAAAAVASAAILMAAAYALWRYWWFWRNPPRRPPLGEHFLSPADGTVVYVHRVAPNCPVVACKQGVTASINDIVREDLGQPKIHIGIFMSPFDVHYNRAPLAGCVESSRQYPAEGRNVNMGSMHWRCILGRLPLYANSPHIVQNNRAVTRFRGAIGGQEVSYYVVQIGGGNVHGIDVFPPPGQPLSQGEIFGMIRIGSQVDLIVPDLDALDVRVRPGDRVKAGESILAAWMQRENQAADPAPCAVTCGRHTACAYYYKLTGESRAEPLANEGGPSRPQQVLRSPQRLVLAAHRRAGVFRRAHRAL